jgi:SAM-dependent methyltransferase
VTDSSPLEYAAWRESTLGRITERLERAVILDLAGDFYGDVLDVGCGVGSYAGLFAAAGARVTGVDSSIPVVRAAAGRARDARAPFHVVAGDASSLPFEASSFDLVVAVTALCFVSSPERALGEMARVLRPGGRLVVGELGRLSAWAAWRRVRTWLGSTAWRRATFVTSGELRRLAEGAGLVAGRVRGAVFYPPAGLAAWLVAPLDPLLGRATTAGAAFVALAAEKPASPRGP